MEQEIRDNKFLEYGEHGENLYGTHLDSIRDVIKQGIYYINIHSFYKGYGKQFKNFDEQIFC